MQAVCLCTTLQLLGGIQTPQGALIKLLCRPVVADCFERCSDSLESSHTCLLQMKAMPPHVSPAATCAARTYSNTTHPFLSVSPLTSSPPCPGSAAMTLSSCCCSAYSHGHKAQTEAKRRASAWCHSGLCKNNPAATHTARQVYYRVMSAEALQHCR